MGSCPCPPPLPRSIARCNFTIAEGGGGVRGGPKPKTNTFSGATKESFKPKIYGFFVQSARLTYTN